MILLLTGALVAGQAVASSPSSATAAPPGASILARAAALAGGPAATVRPRATGELDCNGLSPIQRPARPGMMCEDPRGDHWGRFYENGHYIGHDEPSVRYISDQRGSGADTTFNERLPRDPAAPPTVRRPGHDVTHWFELSVAPWFSTDVCDPYSTPLLHCKPESDSNAPQGKYPGAGAAFVELQFYPPGFAPFTDGISCNNAHWCSALTIDSLECANHGLAPGPCNGKCAEPVNAAFIQTNGVPTGPPSPQLADLATETPNSHTLMMNPGDNITVHMFDARVPGGRALEVTETDHTTGQSGYMIASAKNGFMDTNPFNCKGRPFNFQPEYSTARAQNILPWGFGPYMLNNEYEVGHFEACTTVTRPATLTIGSFTDTYYKKCHGPYETAPDGPPVYEPNDAPCYKAGDTHGGTSAPDMVTGCGVYFDAIGDLDYDGSPYWPDWPDSLTAGPFPTPFLQLQPTTVHGLGYPRIQFMTDNSATQFNTHCNVRTGSGCVLPPKGPGHFYPYFTLAKVGGSCRWEFGNMRNGNTFGGDKQYGKVGPDTIGTFVGPVRANPAC